MTTTKLLGAGYLAAVAVICLAMGKLFAQDPEDNPYSTPISMQVSNETTERTSRTSRSGAMDPVGLRANELATITLTVPVNWANYPVGVAPLDGGEVFGFENLLVSATGTVTFGFKGGNIPGLYRVMVIIGVERYHLRLYVPKPGDLTPDCAPPP